MNTCDIGAYSHHFPSPGQVPRPRRLGTRVRGGGEGRARNSIPAPAAARGLRPSAARGRFSAPDRFSPRGRAGVRGYRSLGAAVAGALILVLASAACGAGESDETGADAGADEAGETGSVGEPDGTDPGVAGSTVTLLTHDSFSISPETLDAFTEATGVTVEQLALGDTGELVSQAVLTAGNPLGDVLFGIDSTFLQRGLDNGLFEPYESPRLTDVPDVFELDPQHRVTPIDYGDVCLNYWIDAFEGAVPPTSLDDLLDPAHEGQLVVQNPETSSPGLAFMLATIVHYGDGWEDYWKGLRDNGVAVTSGWTDAYYGEFTAGGGDRPIVVSYASSPPAEVYYADPPMDEPPTGVVTSGCYRQIEFAGILAGSDNPAGARLLIDFMLTPAFQNDVPLNMFVFPVIESAELPEVFVEHAQAIDEPLTLDPAEVEAGRDAWTDRWTEIVLR